MDSIGFFAAFRMRKASVERCRVKKRIETERIKRGVGGLAGGESSSYPSLAV